MLFFSEGEKRSLNNMTKDQFVALMALLRRVIVELQTLNRLLERQEQANLTESRRDYTDYRTAIRR